MIDRPIILLAMTSVFHFLVAGTPWPDEQILGRVADGVELMITAKDKVIRMPILGACASGLCEKSQG